ncbi:MAG TPA: AsmA-like C-terminal region-containing protein [Candidatus Rifleibacterium sp.]|nr:AsmA-like C-terminal region-containing protein [Candidatus Rifleibacterium sp.]HPT45008.1 AsmA-like C-terminal region-containing protein [Candidatus Rifleibacterium sp.]
MTNLRRVNCCWAAIRPTPLRQSVLLILLVAFFLPMILVNPSIGAENTGLKEQFEKMVSGLIGVPVKVNEYSLDYATVHLKGIKIGDPKNQEQLSAELKELSATCDFMSLLGGNLVLKEITFSSLKGRVTISTAGKSTGQASVGKALTVADLPFNKINGRDIDFRVIDRNSGRTTALDIPTVDVTRNDTQNELRAGFHGRLSLAPPGDQAANAGSVTQFVASLSFNATFSGDLRNPETLANLKLTDGNLTLPDKKLSMQNVSADISAKGLLKKIVATGNLISPTGNVELAITPGSKSAFAFPFKNLVAPLTFANGRLTIENARTEVFGGSVSGNGVLETGKTPIGMQVDARSSGLRVEAFLSENTTQQQALTGPVDAVFKASGDVTGLNTWNGMGSLLLKNGRYQAPPVITPVLSLVNLKEFSSGDLTEASGTFALKDGIFTTSDLAALTGAGNAYYRGTVGLDTTLKGQLELKFSPAAVERSQVLQQISLDSQTVMIPTRVEGTLLAPVFPGFSAQKLLELGLKRKGQKMLQGIIMPGSGKTTDQQPQKDSGKNLLNDLQNIFKKKKSSGSNLAPDSTGKPPAAPTKKEDALKKGLKNLFKF